MTILQRKTQLEQRKQTAKDIGFVMASAMEYIAVWAVYMVIITKMLRIM
jgi:hypothetical protein